GVRCATQTRSSARTLGSHGATASSYADMGPPSTTSAPSTVDGTVSPACGRTRSIGASPSQSANRSSGQPGSCSITTTRRGSNGSPMIGTWGLEHRKHGVAFVRRDLAPEVVPLGALVSQEEVEDMLAERLRHKLRTLHLVDRLVQRRGQRIDAERRPLELRQRPYVVLGTRRKLVA